MALTYYFTGTGGVGASPDGTIPPGAVVCTEEQYQNASDYIIDYSTTPYSIEAISEASALEIAQAAQVALISNACNAAILGGFTSSALGATYTYPAKTTDQVNLLSSDVSAILAWAVFAGSWEASTAVAVDQYAIVNKQLYKVTVAGKTSSEEPTWPTVAGTAVLDGSAQWELWTTPFWCADVATDTWAWRDHTAMQIFRVGIDGKATVLSMMKQNAELAAEIAAATTVEQVEAITWP